MPRQSRPAEAVVLSSTQSMKGNLVNGAVKVKMEKVKEQQTKMKEEHAKGARARVDEEEPDAHDGADASGDEDDEEGSGSPKGRKRARANTNGDSRPSQSQNGAETEGTTLRAETLPRDEEDGFIPGSITRIQLRNFVTYDFVEFAPGPYLNMIIGPNGTGKSSIACAIALGLNFPPKVLGRAEEIFAFVKNGTPDGHIEIELKSKPGKPNLVIRRKLVANSKTSTFMLNGKNATGKEVSIKMAELGVQVGNLCSFLPQDKVSEFAMMSSQQLLKETQKAAGDTNLTSWHESLIDAGKENRMMKEKIASEQSQLAQMHARNAAIENEVERYNERKKIEETIAMLEVYIPSATYRELLARYGELKEVQRKLHQRVRQLKAKNEPAHALLNRLRSDLKDLDKQRETRKKDTQKLFQDMKKLHSTDEELENLSETHYSKLEHLAHAERERQQQIRDLEGKIQRMEEEFNAPLPDEVKQVLEDVDGSIKKEKASFTHERNEIVSRRDDLGNQLKYKMEEKAVVMRNIDEAEKSIRQLDSVDHQKLEAMQRFSRDTADAIRWLRNNKARFRMEIIEPALLTLTVPDRRYQAAVENVLNGSSFKTFVAQCQEDYDLLNELINDKGALGRKAQISSWFRDPNHFQLHPPPMSPEEMQELGFDGYLADFVSAPQAMIWFLKNDASLHRIAVALKPKSVNVQHASDLIKRSGGSIFIVGPIVNNIRLSKYGKRTATNTTSDLKPARLLAAHTVDNDAKRGFEQTIKRLTVDVSAKEDEISMLKDEGRKIEAEAKALDERVEAIQGRIKSAKAAEAAKLRLKTNLTREKTILKQKKAVPSADQERTEIRTRLVNLAKKRLKIVKEYTVLSKKVVLEQQETTRLGLQYLQVNANRAALEELCEKKDEKFNRAMAEFHKIDEKYEEVKKLSKEALNKSRDALNSTTDEIREKYKEEIQIKRAEYDAALKAAEANGTTPPSSEGVDLRTADEYRAELDAQEAQLELVSKTQPGVIEQYEKRKRDIEVLERTLEERQRNASKVERGLKSTLDRWKPALEKLVNSIGRKFSAAFDRIGCAGEIRISENEDYDKWALDILVKFRDEEKLQLLTGQRQSGGERSLTTILYLMSLTEEARAPFSLVDEINQGMDQRAERLVHDNMVDVTCKDDSSQYFLITPKLLPDLKYHERMKILCVNNGEWLPEETRVGNLMNLIEGFVSNKRNRAVNGQ